MGEVHRTLQLIRESLELRAPGVIFADPEFSDNPNVRAYLVGCGAALGYAIYDMFSALALQARNADGLDESMVILGSVRYENWSEVVDAIVALEQSQLATLAGARPIVLRGQQGETLLEID
jgi:hypothetical protein